MAPETTYSSKNLDHLGIVSVICDEIKLVQTIDFLVPSHPKALLTNGECIKLMVLNGLGFTSKPLYLEAEFFKNRPLERLLGREVDIKEISDDRLGRCLDRCFEANCNQLFASVSTKATDRFGVEKRFRHLDTSSFTVHGEYEDEEGIGLIQYGHSKDHRPDLKQFMLSLVCSQDGDVPLLAETIAGNTSDKTHFHDILKAMKDQIKESNDPCCFVVDSAMYVGKTIAEISEVIKWISRVPERIVAAKKLTQEIEKSNMDDVGDGYFIKEVCSNYAKVKQRWLLVYSEQAFKREKHTLDRNITKEEKAIAKALKTIESKSFSCANDARNALKEMEKSFKYHCYKEKEVTEKNTKKGKGRPKKGEEIKKTYKIKGDIEKNKSNIEAALQSKGKFIVATNELDDKVFSNTDILENYKNQQCVERGFRFLKNPSFLTPSIYLKKEERIVALSMVMCLCLLVYTLAQRFLRLNLKKKNETVPNAAGKQTQKITMRRVFEMFEGVHLLIIQVGDKVIEKILNLTPSRILILEKLGPPFLQVYDRAA